MNQNNNTMSYKVKESQEIIWCEYDDRYILVVKEDNKVIGINFMQSDDLELFKKHYNCIDTELTKFYLATYRFLSGECELDRINQAMWAYVETKMFC